MFTNTRYEQKGQEGVVLMPKSGIYQDKGRTRYVTISRRKPMLYAWARRYNFQGKGFMFTKKPFIRRGINNSLKELMPIMRPHVRAGIREAKQ
jgi:hypothetical protein